MTLGIDQRAERPAPEGVTKPAPAIECRDLVRNYGDRVAVDGVSFNVHVGETYGLLGPNGAGKTTTISMLSGILEPDSGEVRVFGRQMRHQDSAMRRDIGVVPQDIALYPDLSARENLRFFGRLYSLRGKDLESRIDECLTIVGLADRGNDLIEEYSGGMKRRANIAAGLLHRPRLLILDEPTVGVDPQSRYSIMDSVERLGGEGLSIVYTSHYMEEVERLCKRVGILDNGKLIAEGTQRELVKIVGEQDRVDLTVTGSQLDVVRACQGLSRVTKATATGDVVQILVEDAHSVLPNIISVTEASGAHITSVNIVEPNLEAVFLHLTGRGLRD